MSRSQRQVPGHSRAAAAALAMLLPACTSYTHADEFEVAEATSEPPLCQLCPAHPELRHPPCAPQSASDSGDLVVVFALRALDLGIRASGWTSGYIVGLDQDCSDRPGGIPTSCVPRTQTGWASLSGGVDNALATQVLFPLLEDANIDLQVEVNQALDKGQGSILLVVDSWNGQLDDPQVGVRLVPGIKVVNSDGRTQPSWNGDDEWAVFADRWDPDFPGRYVPDSVTKSRDAYVKAGTLVWDARSVHPFGVMFAVGGANVELDLENVVMFGGITTYDRPRQLINAVLGGIWSSFLAYRKAEALAQIAEQCDACAVKDMAPNVERLLQSAPDMLLPTSSAPGVCDAISVGFLGSYLEIGHITSLVPLADMPVSCAGVPACPR